MSAEFLNINLPALINPVSPDNLSCHSVRALYINVIWELSPFMWLPSCHHKGLIDGALQMVDLSDALISEEEKLLAVPCDVYQQSSDMPSVIINENNK